MQTYQTSNLTSMTPEAEQTKLTAALEGVDGVFSVTLRPDSSEFEIKAQKQTKPKRADITEAASKAGFTVSTKK